MTTFHRPTFPSAQAYLASCRQNWAEGRSEWPPGTAAEVRILCEHYPHRKRQWLPREPWLSMLGLDDLAAEPLSEIEQERLLATIANDTAFARALSRAIARGAA